VAHDLIIRNGTAVDGTAREHPEYVDDLPNGAGRFRISSREDAATIVNGVVVTERGWDTGERAGRVIREFARG
jgi:N-acyl-D-aspartate/D-glutamate deacylase